MEGLWLENQQISFQGDLPEPVPGTGEALVKVELAGICSTDLELVRGYYPFRGIIGHEFVGRVISVGDGDPGAQEWIGKRVVGEINVSCGACEACRLGNPTHCERRNVLGIKDRNGAFADRLTLPLINLHRVPDQVRKEAAVFTEPLAAALEIVQQIQIRPSDRVLVVGAGRLGQLVCQTLVLTGCDLKAVVRHSHQKELLSRRGIATCREDEIQPQRWDIVIEATGAPEGFKLARKAVRPRGTIVVKSTYRGELTIEFSPIVVDEVTLVGSRCGPFPPALRLIASGAVDPTILIQDRFPLKDGLAAFQMAGQPGVFKILLEP